MKSKIFSIIGLSLLLISCDVSSSISFSSTEESDSSSIESSTSQKSIDLSQYSFDDQIYTPSSIEIFVGETYNIGCLNTKGEEYSNEIYSSDESIVSESEAGIIKGNKIGEATISILVSNCYDQINIKVKSKEELAPKIKLNKGRLYGKRFCVFGDSISDTSVSNYTDRPTFWTEMLASRFNMKTGNYARSGATTGYSHGLIDKSSSYISILATTMVNASAVKKKLAKSEFAFIYSGNNDASYGVEIGEYGDINDENRKTTESFKGSYTYLIDKIKEANPDITIICLSLSYSTWGIEKHVSNNYFKTRQAMAQCIGEIAEYKNVKFVNLFDLWSASNYSTYIPDGMHPQTAGYELIVERILNS